jgi:Fe-S-cluster-containing hydrogenase component 2
MAGKGLLFRYRKRGAVRYAAIPFVVGAYEFQLKNLDRELAQLMERYMEEAFQIAAQNSLTPLRTIPVYRSLDVAWKVAPFQDAREIVKSQETIALADCLCRVQQGLLEQACDKPLEVCMIFGSHADFYVENGMARLVGTQEALDVLDKCEEAGLVNQPFNTVNPGGMCNCCGDCCGVLRSFKKHPRPSEIVFNDYLARVSTDDCDACETCLERCQMEAIFISEEGHAEVNQDRCIGCGLCVTTCPTEAMKLVLKPESQRAKPPRSAQDLVTRQMEKRGTSLIPLALQNKD